MRVSILVIGAVILTLGEISVALVQDKLTDYEKLLTPTDESMKYVEGSSIYKLAETIRLMNPFKYGAIIVGIAGMSVIIYGVFAKEKRVGYCKECGASLYIKPVHNKEDVGYCKECGASLPNKHANNKHAHNKHAHNKQESN